MADEIVKHCPTCKEDKPLPEFYRNRKYPDGRHVQCKPCMSASMKRHRHYLPASTKLELTSKQVARFWHYVDKSPGHGPNGDCWIWTGCLNHKGYAQFSLGTARALPAARITYFIATGIDIHPLQGLHHCDNPPCVRPDHIFPGTHQDNMSDRNKKHRQAKGQRWNGARRTTLTAEQIEYICTARAAGTQLTVVAKTVGKSPSYVSQIANGRSNPRT